MNLNQQWLFDNMFYLHALQEPELWSDAARPAFAAGYSRWYIQSACKGNRIKYSFWISSFLFDKTSFPFVYSERKGILSPTFSKLYFYKKCRKMYSTPWNLKFVTKKSWKTPGQRSAWSQRLTDESSEGTAEVSSVIRWRCINPLQVNTNNLKNNMKNWSWCTK